jgi:hypothetical protein
MLLLSIYAGKPAVDFKPNRKTKKFSRQFVSQILSGKERKPLVRQGVQKLLHRTEWAHISDY